jgi:undecaprenyl-diphosphatase
MQTGLPLLLEIAQMVATLALVVPSLHFAFGAYARHHRPGWSKTLERRRFAILLMLVCAVTAIQIGEDVLDGDTHLIDQAILLHIHRQVSGPMMGFFEVVTLSGSSKVLVPMTVAGTIALLAARKRFEAALLASSTILGALLIYAIKMMVGRPRPQLWETETYWGSSFPSGHTLAVAAFVTAAVLCAVRIRPELQTVASIIGLAWIALVGLSRLVLGVHWPTDMLVAACLGAFIPLAISVAHELRVSNRTED